MQKRVFSYLKLYPKQTHMVGFHTAENSRNLEVGKLENRSSHINISLKWKTFIWELGQDEILFI